MSRNDEEKVVSPVSFISSSLWYNNVIVFQIPEKLVKSGPRPKNMNKPIKKQSI
jgi:hypothetical protein